MYLAYTLNDIGLYGSRLLKNWNNSLRSIKNEIMYYYSGAQIEEKKQRRKYSGSVPLTIISDLLNEQKLSFLKIRAFNQLNKTFKKNRY